MKKANDALELIGNTPLVKLKKIIPEGCADIWAKLESYNPGGSVKDRIALSMIEDAEDKGVLAAGKRIIEPTSGNTGIGLALVAAVKGYELVLTMPETMSAERVSLMKLFGAEILLTPGVEGMTGAVEKALTLEKESNGYVILQQFDNPANPQIHYETTGPEIWEQTSGKLDAFVAGIGTGGTVTGVGRFLKEKDSKANIIGLEPKQSPVLTKGVKGPHKIQGIGAGFVPKVLDREILDEVLTVDDGEALLMRKRLALEEGLSVGISSGAAAIGALEVAKKLGPGKTIITVFPDIGERYLSLS